MIRAGLKQLRVRARYKGNAGCSDGRMAVEKYKEVNPDVILMDINMPVQTALKRLRK